MKIKKNSAPLPGEQPLQLFVENPSEEDAAIVDKILSSRIMKKEVSDGTFHLYFIFSGLIIKIIIIDFLFLDITWSDD